MKELFRKEKEKEDLLKRFGYDVRRARGFIFAKSNLSRGPLLEIGTGKGHFALALAQKGFTFTSIDLDPDPQKIAKAYLRQSRLDKNVFIRIMDAGSLKFPDDAFENVISVNFMHHAKKALRCLAEMVRVAQRKIVVADVNQKGAGILKRVHRLEGHGHPDSRISFEAMRGFLKKKGFKVKTYKGFCQTVLVAERSQS